MDTGGMAVGEGGYRPPQPSHLRRPEWANHGFPTLSEGFIPTNVSVRLAFGGAGT